MKIKKITLLTLLVFLSHYCLFAQKDLVHAVVTPDSILIGQQAILNVEVKSHKDELVLFPMYKDTITAGVEVLNNEIPVDTILEQKGGKEVVILSKKYVITSFDSLNYVLPPIPVIVGTDTLRSDSTFLAVTLPTLSKEALAYAAKYKNGETDSLNFNKLDVKDIKNIVTPPFVWQDYFVEFLIVIAIIFLVSLLVFLYVLYNKKKKRGYYFKPKIVLPPHVIAMNSLNEMREKDLISQGLIKEYHTELTDIVRRYIKDRYNIDAQEMLTKDIIKELEIVESHKGAIRDLNDILFLGDLVKFAKFEPQPHENDKSYNQAISFVENTKNEQVDDKTIDVQDGDSQETKFDGKQSEQNAETENQKQ